MVTSPSTEPYLPAANSDGSENFREYIYLIIVRDKETRQNY